MKYMGMRNALLYLIILGNHHPFAEYAPPSAENYVYLHVRCSARIDYRTRSGDSFSTIDQLAAAALVQGKHPPYV